MIKKIIEWSGGSATEVMPVIVGVELALIAIYEIMDYANKVKCKELFENIKNIESKRGCSFRTDDTQHMQSCLNGNVCNYDENIGDALNTSNEPC